VKKATPCTIEGCAKTVECRGLCPMHYQRWRQTGDPGPADPMRQSHRGKTCAVEGCGQTRRKLEWCTTHYSQRRRTGEEPKPVRYRWAERLDACKLCGRPTVSEFREYCSAACRLHWANHGGPADLPICAQCDRPISLVRAHANGRHRRRDVKVCLDCKNELRDRRAMLERLAHVTKALCGICHEPVNLSIRHPSPKSPSVDHVIPKAKGGTNEFTNLQLAHLGCNSAKRDRVA
jgi:hypothetical protein